MGAAHVRNAVVLISHQLFSLFLFEEYYLSLEDVCMRE